jgi:hypothetical protein
MTGVLELDLICPEGQTKQLDSTYPFLFNGAALSNAHRAKVDVEGLVRIINTCEYMKSCLLLKMWLIC